MSFYRKRLVKLYPPYLAAHIVFVAIGLTSLVTAVKSLLFVSMFIGPPPGTLWFMSFIFTCYALLPLLSRVGRSAGAMAALVVALWLLWRGAAIILPMDLRLLVYFPVFALGVFLGRSGQSLDVLRAWLPGLLVLAAAIAVTQMHFVIDPERDPRGVAFATLAGATALTLATWPNRLRLSSRWHVLADATFFLYLFHRPVFSVLNKLGRPDAMPVRLTLLVIVWLPIALIACLGLHKAYQWLTGRRPVNLPHRA